MKIEHHPSQQTAIERLDSAQICGFGQRLGAFIIDVILLWIVGKILGSFFEPFARIGEWCIFIGFAIALLYFGIFNSAVRQGQTLFGQNADDTRFLDRYQLQARLRPRYR